MSDNDLWGAIRDRDAENARMRCEIERLRAGIQSYLDGNYDHPRAHRTTELKCKHGVFYYRECRECDEVHFQSLLNGAR